MTKFSERFSELFLEATLWILSFVLFMSKPWESTLQAMDSSIHARMALEVTKNGLIPALPMPNLNLDTALPYFNDHPFTLFYFVGHFMRLFGADAWSARFIPSLFAVFSVVLVYRMGKKYFSEATGFISALVLMLTPMWILYAARFQLDPAMCFFILLSFYFWLDQKSALAGFFVGVAVAVKSPVGLLLLPAAFITDVILQKNMRAVRGLFIAGLCALIAPVVVWSITASVGGKELAWDYVQRQVLGTALQGRNYVQEYSFFSFADVLWNRNKLFTIFLLIALTQLRNTRELFQQRTTQLFGVGALVLVVVISLMRFKFPHYFLPAFPLLAIVVGALLAKIFEERENAFQKLQIGVSVLAVAAPVVLLIFPISTAPESFPALRKFIPFIQTYGDPSDKVLFVNHAQPYGSEGDYFVEVIFYTGKKFLSAQCGNAEEKISLSQPEWILTSGKDISECISLKALSAYPFRLKAGNQYLLAKKATNSAGVFDLTPLYGELKASVDGVPLRLPRTIFYRYE